MKGTPRFNDSTWKRCKGKCKTWIRTKTVEKCQSCKDYEERQEKMNYELQQDK